MRIESEYFLTLTYLPPEETEEKIRGWMFDGLREFKSSAERALEFFKSRVSAFDDIFSSLFTAERLRAVRSVDEHGFPAAHDQLLRYVQRCVTLIDHPFALPEVPAYLSEIVGTADFVAGVTPKVGRKHLRVIAIDGFPRLSFPGILGHSIHYRSSTAGTRALFCSTQSRRPCSTRRASNGARRYAAGRTS